MRRNVAVVVVVAALAGVSWVPVASAAAPVQSTLRIWVSDVRPGQRNVKVAASGFPAKSTAVFRFDATLLGSTEIASTGRGELTFTVPASALPGTHSVRAFDGKVSATVPILVRTNWAMPGFDVHDSGSNRYENVLTPRTVSGMVQAWSTGTFGTDADVGSPAVYDGVVYVGVEFIGGPDQDPGEELAINASTGATTVLVYNDFSLAAPIISGDAMYFSDGGGLVAYSLQGRFLWDNIDACGATLDNGVLYAAGADKFWALNPADGTVEWSIPTISAGAFCDWPVAIDGTMAFATGGTSSGPGETLEAINLSTQSLAWSTQVNPYPNILPPTAADGVVLAGGAGLKAYDETSGALRWSAAADLGGQGVVDQDIAYIAGDSGIEAIDISTGQLLWGNNQPGLPVALAGGVLYVHHAGLEALDASNGTTLWSQDDPDATYEVAAQPAIVNGQAFDPSTDTGVTAWTIGS